VVKAKIDVSRNVIVGGDVSTPATPASASGGHNSHATSPAVTVGDGSVVKAEIDASQSVSVRGDMVSRKEVHSHQTTNVYKESGVRAISDAFGGVGTPPQTAQECIEKLTREIHSGIGVMPFIVLVFFWPVGLYLILTAGRRKEAKVNELFACLRGLFLAQGEARQEDYDRLQAEWANARRSTKRQSIIVTCVVVGLFAGVYAMAFVSIAVMEGKGQSTREQIIQLIEEGRFGAARIKARELPSYEQDEIIEDIKAAEERWDRGRSSNGIHPKGPKTERRYVTASQRTRTRPH